MVSASRLLLLGVCLAAAVAIADSKPRLSKREVVAIAKRAIIAKFPWSAEKHYRYDAFYESDGIWGVYVPHPNKPDMFGGGDPNAWVRDRDGKVLQVFLAR